VVKLYSSQADVDRKSAGTGLKRLGTRAATVYPKGCCTRRAAAEGRTMQKAVSHLQSIG
jgi:hypothetical protein